MDYRRLIRPLLLSMTLATIAGCATPQATNPAAPAGAEQPAATWLDVASIGVGDCGVPVLRFTSARSPYGFNAIGLPSQFTQSADSHGRPLQVVVEDLASDDPETHVACRTLGPTLGWVRVRNARWAGEGD